MSLGQTDAQTAGQDSASGAWVMMIEPSGQAQPHRTGGGGAGRPLAVTRLVTPTRTAKTEAAAAMRTSIFIRNLLVSMNARMAPSTSAEGRASTIRTVLPCHAPMPTASCTVARRVEETP